MTRRMSMPELVSEVRKYARDHYEEDGWDFVVECYSDEEIAERIGKARTRVGAIANVLLAVKTVDDYRKDIQNA